MPNTSRMTATRGAAIALAVVLGTVSGCAWVPRGRIDDCRQRAQVLQTENQQLRDVLVRVRQDNKDLAQRSLDDSRRLRAQDEAIRRYERSIADYQDERDQLHALLDQIRGQVRTAALAPPTTAMIGRLEAFVRDHPDGRLEPSRGTLLLRAGALFAPNRDTLTAEGEALLDALADALGGPGTPGLALRVAGTAAESANVVSSDADVRLASTNPQSPPTVGGASMIDGLERARRIRDHLADRLGIDPSLVAVSAGGTTTLDNPEPTPATAAASWVAIQVRRRLADPTAAASP